MMHISTWLTGSVEYGWALVDLHEVLCLCHVQSKYMFACSICNRKVLQLISVSKGRPCAWSPVFSSAGNVTTKASHEGHKNFDAHCDLRQRQKMSPEGTFRVIKQELFIYRW